MPKIKFLLLFLFFSCTAFAGCTNSKTLTETENRKNIDFIAKMNSGDYWDSIKMGANEAAKEFNVNLNFIGPNNETDISAQLKEVNNAAESKSDGIVLAPTDYKTLSDAAAKIYDKKIPIIIVDSGISTDKINAYIASDNKAAGEKLAEKLISIVGKNSSIGIINFVKGSRNAQEREEGALSLFKKYAGVKVMDIEYCNSDKQLAYNITKSMLSNHSSINGIIALNTIASAGAAEAISDMNMKGKVYLVAFDSTTEEISYIDNGVIAATLVQKQFNMGYLAVKYAAMAARGGNIPNKVVTDFIIVDKNSIHLPQYERIVFPFIP